jgi:DNA polymerase-4
MAERIVVHVDMNAFFASVEQQAHPALRGKPIVVCGGPSARSVVAACSYEAKAYGIANGMSVAEARRRCPWVLPVSGHPEQYVDLARRIFAFLATLSPRMEVGSIDEAFLDLTDTFRFFGAAPEAAARLIKQRIQILVGLTCSIGIGPNKLVAKLAANQQKPDGLVRVRADEVAAFLEPLPVEALCGVGPTTAARLQAMGIVTCGQLGRAPEPELIRRFGLLGRALARMGQGCDEQPVALASVEPPVQTMSHSVTLPRDTADHEQIRGTLLRLAEQVARRLRADGSQGWTVELIVRYADFTTHAHQQTLAAPTDSGPRIWRAAMALLERHWAPPARRVRLVGVGVSTLDRGERQPSFLPEDVAAERLTRCLDHLADRFGECVVVRASALAPLSPKAHGFLLHQRSRRRGSECAPSLSRRRHTPRRMVSLPRGVC